MKLVNCPGCPGNVWCDGCTPDEEATNKEYLPMRDVELIGNVGKKQALRKTNEDVQVIAFTLAAHPTEKADNEDTIWFTCTCWRGLANTVNQYVQVGDKLYIRGVFTPRTYTRNDGSTATSYNVQVEKLVMLGSKSNNKNTEDETNIENLDGVPF